MQACGVSKPFDRRASFFFVGLRMWQTDRRPNSVDIFYMLYDRKYSMSWARRCSLYAYAFINDYDGMRDHTYMHMHIGIYEEWWAGLMNIVMHKLQISCMHKYHACTNIMHAQISCMHSPARSNALSLHSGAFNSDAGAGRFSPVGTSRVLATHGRRGHCRVGSVSLDISIPGSTCACLDVGWTEGSALYPAHPLSINNSQPQNCLPVGSMSLS